MPKYNANLIRKNLRDMLDFPHDLNLQEMLDPKEAAQINKFLESEQITTALDKLSNILIEKKPASQQKVKNNPYDSFLSNISAAHATQIKKLMRNFILMHEITPMYTPERAEKLKEQYTAILEKCHGSDMPSAQLTALSETLINYGDFSQQENLRKAGQSLIPTLYNNTNLANVLDNPPQLLELNASEALRNTDETLKELLACASSESLPSEIGPLNAGEFLKKAKKIKEDYNKAQGNKAEILNNGLAELQQWSKEKEQKTPGPALSKIGKFLASAIKAVHYTIHGDKEKVLAHRALMTQISEELSGKNKKFSANLQTLEQNLGSFAERIKAEKSNNVSHPQQR